MGELTAKAWPDKLIIGLTGNIATGKSAVMRLAAEEGALTIDADRLVHEILDSDPDMQASIAVAFGPEVRRLDGRINRRALGEIVFNDPAALQDLEAMVHPAVSQEIARQLDEKHQTIVFIEAIKLLESDLAGLCRQVWVTRCSEKMQMTRLRVCRGLNSKSAAARIKSQPPPEEKVAQADVVIDTDGHMTDTERQFQHAWDRLPDENRTELTRRNADALKARARQQIQGKGVVQPQPKRERPAKKKSVPVAERPKPKKTDKSRPLPAGLEARRARPSDIPSILLHIRNATNGAVKMKRAELLMAFSERSYFIGQNGTEISTIIGFSIDSQVASIDQIFIHPLEKARDTCTAVLNEIQKSAFNHLCEIILAFIPLDAPKEIVPIFEAEGFVKAEKETLPKVWQRAIAESQPANTRFLLKILVDDRLRTS